MVVVVIVVITVGHDDGIGIIGMTCLLAKVHSLATLVEVNLLPQLIHLLG